MKSTVRNSKRGRAMMANCAFYGDIEVSTPSSSVKDI